jgi:hypothetical protein
MLFFDYENEHEDDGEYEKQSSIVSNLGRPLPLCENEFMQR